MAFGLSLPSIKGGISRAQAQPNSKGIFSDIGQFVSGAVNPTTTDNHFSLVAPTAPQAPGPAAPTDGGGSYYPGSGGGGGTAAVYNNAQADAELGRLPGQEAVGRGNILASYNAALQTLLNGRGSAERNYNTTRGQTIQENQTAKSNIDASVGRQVSALQRLFGARGAGNSSASSVLAPFSAALQGNQQRQQVQESYGRNMGALDNNWQDFLTQFDNSRRSLDDSKTNQERNLLQGLAQTRQKLLSAKGDPALAGQINDLGHQIDSLGALQVSAPQAANFEAPDLAKYNYDPTKGAELTGAGDGTDMLGAYYTLLNGGKKKQATGV
jgi:hypothetical protein